MLDKSWWQSGARACACCGVRFDAAHLIRDHPARSGESNAEMSDAVTACKGRKCVEGWIRQFKSQSVSVSLRVRVDAARFTDEHALRSLEQNAEVLLAVRDPKCPT